MDDRDALLREAAEEMEEVLRLFGPRPSIENLVARIKQMLEADDAD